MPSIAESRFYNGAEQRIERLGLARLWEELRDVLTGFQLCVEERRDANGGAAVRSFIDARFARLPGWIKKQTGDVDWTKCDLVDGARVCLGVEVQFSARSDLMIVDVAHLREQITAGAIDVGVLVVPTERLASFLTDRVGSITDAARAVERAQASQLPLAILALEHDGPGPLLGKRKKRPPGLQ